MGLSCRIGVLRAAASLSADFSSDPTREPDQHRLLFRSHSHQLSPIQPTLLPHQLIPHGVVWLEGGEEEAVFLCSLAAWRLSRAWSCSQRSLGT